MKKLRLALAQTNPVVGDLEGNTEKIINYIRKAEACAADIIAFPELALTGYPPEDLLLKPQFVKDNLGAMRTIADEVRDITAVVGFVDRREDIYNAAAIIHNRNILDVYHKMYLPNYGVFDENRYFQAGTRFPVYDVCGVPVGITICEDIWYPEGPAHIQSLAGAELIINLNASPYHAGKAAFREKMVSTRAADDSVIIAYLNTVGGQDELVFDGQSFVVNEKGEVVYRGKQFREDFIIVDLDIEAVSMKRLYDHRRRHKTLDPASRAGVERIVIPGVSAKKEQAVLAETVCAIPMKAFEEVYNALKLGVSDYIRKNNFKTVVIGLSGGVDSSLVATLAVDSIGKDNVKVLFMPSPYTSDESREDAYTLASNLGIVLIEMPITEIYNTYLFQLSGNLKGLPQDTAEENLQARIRGNILMLFSNKFNWLVLTTGNKSEMSVGYATLYGDMAGGFAVIKDVSKTMVYELCRWRNGEEGKALIPERVLTREPSAELKPGQKDTDTLPPYNILDPILKAYVEEEKSFEEVLALGFEAGDVEKVISMTDSSEYKRRQSPPGIKITERAFGRDWRFPITNRYQK